MKESLDALETLQCRMDQLEAKHRRALWINRGLIGILLLVSMGAGAVNSGPEIRAHRLILEGDDGQEVVRLEALGKDGLSIRAASTNPSGAVLTFSSTGMQFGNPSGPWIRLGQGDTGKQSVKNPKDYPEAFWGIMVADAKQRARLGMGIFKDNSTTIYNVDPEGQFRMGLSVDKEGYALLKIYDRFGNRVTQFPAE